MLSFANYYHPLTTDEIQTEAKTDHQLEWRSVTFYFKLRDLPCISAFLLLILLFALFPLLRLQ